MLVLWKLDQYTVKVFPITIPEVLLNTFRIRQPQISSSIYENMNGTDLELDFYKKNGEEEDNHSLKH